jgi:D-inositol-3-phosphate glycosyltransferase
VSTYKPLNTEKTVRYREERGDSRIYRLSWFGKGFFQKLEKYPALEVLYLTPGLLVQSFCLLLRNHREISVIHTQGFVAGLIGCVLSLFGRRKMVFSDHTVYGIKNGSLVSRIFSFVANRHDAILAVSELARTELVSWGVPQRKITVFRYWSNTSIFAPRSKAQAKRELGIDVHSKVLVNVARLDHAKGLDILVEAAAIVLRNRQDVVFYIINSAKSERHFLDFLGLDALPSNCRFVGRVDYHELSRWYCAADCLLVTSRREGYSRVTIESLLCGTPVIGSKTGSLVDVLSEEVALFVDEVSAEGFARGVQQIFAAPERLTRMGEAAIAYSRKSFTETNASAIFRSYG